MVLGNHLVPGETVSWVGLRFWGVPVLGLRLFGFLFLGEAFSFLDLVIPELYTGDVSCNGAGKPLVVGPACRAFGLPRLAMIMASSSSAARLLALRRSPSACVVACLGKGWMSSKSSVTLEAPLWNSCSSCRLAIAKM